MGKISQITVDQASSLAKNLPSILISIIFTILSAYFFIADRDRILEFGRANTPGIIQEKWRILSDSFKQVFGGYFKAQFKIMGVIGVILFVGFLIMRVKFAALVAILIAFLDMPVSYTHLDVYKRQLQEGAGVLVCNIRISICTEPWGLFWRSGW